MDGELEPERVRRDVGVDERVRPLMPRTRAGAIGEPQPHPHRRIRRVCTQKTVARESNPHEPRRWLFALEHGEDEVLGAQFAQHTARLAALDP